MTILEKIKSVEEFKSNKSVIIDELTQEVFDYIKYEGTRDDGDYMQLYAVKKNVKKWYDNKLSLIEKLSTAPGWDWSTLSLVNDYSEIIKGSLERALEKTSDLISMLSSDYADINATKNAFLQRLLNRYYSRCATKIDDDERSIYNAVLKALELPLIKKDSNVLKYLNNYNNSDFISYYKDRFNRTINEAFDLMRDKTFKRVRYTSVHPLSYIQAGEGNSWSSCYTFEGNYDGSYSGVNRFGCFGYMVDGVTLVTMHFSARLDVVDGVDFRQKIYRHYLHVVESQDSNISILCGRVYPQKNDYNREKTFNILSGAIEDLAGVFSSLPFNTYKNDNIVSNIYETATLDCFGYNDLTCSYCYNVNPIFSTIESIELLDDTLYNNVYIGAAAYYLDDGEEWEDGDDVDGCCREGCRVYCRECGRRIDEEDAYYIDGDYYCEDCSTRCECCDEYAPNEDMHTLYTGDIVCEHCFNNYCVYCIDIDDCVHEDDAYYCDIDGNYYYNEDEAPTEEEEDDED